MITPHTIYEKWGGGGGGQSTSGPIYEKWEGGGGGGGQFASGTIRKVGGGGAIRFRSDTESGEGGGPILCLAQRRYFIVNHKRL